MSVILLCFSSIYIALFLVIFSVGKFIVKIVSESRMMWLLAYSARVLYLSFTHAYTRTSLWDFFLLLFSKLLFNISSSISRKRERSRKISPTYSLQHTFLYNMYYIKEENCIPGIYTYTYILCHYYSGFSSTLALLGYTHT